MLWQKNLLFAAGKILNDHRLRISTDWKKDSALIYGTMDEDVRRWQNPAERKHCIRVRFGLYSMHQV